MIRPITRWASTPIRTTTAPGRRETLERLCGHIDHREAWRLIRDIADAVSYLHRNQIIHCDLKTSNILLTDETPSTSDLRLRPEPRTRRRGAHPVGTPLYASPEQLRNPRDSADGNGLPLGTSTALGVVAFKLLTGELPRLRGYAAAERGYFDPESTIYEAGTETSPETRARPSTETRSHPRRGRRGDRVARGFYIPGDRKLLIEQCLKPEPPRASADMREVWSRISQLDQQAVVNAPAASTPFSRSCWSSPCGPPASPSSRPARRNGPPTKPCSPPSPMRRAPAPPSISCSCS